MNKCLECKVDSGLVMTQCYGCDHGEEISKNDQSRETDNRGIELNKCLECKVDSGLNMMQCYSCDQGESTTQNASIETKYDRLSPLLNI